MTADFVPYQEALELKALGFDEPCIAFYEQSKRLSIGFNWLNEGGKNSNLQECTAPLYQQAFRWFREKYDLSSWISGRTTMGFSYTIDASVGNFVYNTHEEAEQACLDKLIEIVKNK